MKTIAYKTLDKGKWLRGPWDNEPDKIQWQDDATRMPCLIVRQPASGHLCGYVGVTEGHPWFGRECFGCDADIHGGLTYSDFCQPRETEDVGVCHVPGDGEPHRVWWLGFDCAHYNDMSHVCLGGRYFMLGEYRDVDYVRAQCERLAKQAKETAKRGRNERE